MSICISLESKNVCKPAAGLKRVEGVLGDGVKRPSLVKFMNVVMLVMTRRRAPERRELGEFNGGAAMVSCCEFSVASLNSASRTAGAACKALDHVVAASAASGSVDVSWMEWSR